MLTRRSALLGAGGLAATAASGILPANTTAFAQGDDGFRLCRTPQFSLPAVQRILELKLGRVDLPQFQILSDPQSTVAPSLGEALPGHHPSLPAKLMNPFLFQLVEGASRWTPNDLARDADGNLVVPVMFLDGNAAQHACVRSIAPEWTGLQGAKHVRFAFDSGDASGIRISFEKGRGYWSLVGNAAKHDVGRGEPTMTLDELSGNAADSAVRFYVLHEFGHALGLLHEHKHPEAHIVWNEAAIVADLEASEFQDKPDDDVKRWVKTEIVDVYGDAKYRCEDAPGFDPKSIMNYPIRKGWANIEIERGQKLADNDLACVRRLYGAPA